MKLSYLSIFLIILGFTFSVLLVYYTQRKSILAFEPYYKMKHFKPNKIRYGIASFVYALPFSVLSVVLVLFITKEITLALISSVITPLYLLTLALAAYPYYIIATYDGKINGATLSGGGWQRAEIGINEIDTDRILRQGFGRLFGIIVIHSINGAKILAVGLDNIQLTEILESGKVS